MTAEIAHLHRLRRHPQISREPPHHGTFDIFSLQASKVNLTSINPHATRSNSSASLLTPFTHSVNAILPDIGLTKTIHINRDIISLGKLRSSRQSKPAFGTSTLFKTLPASYCFLLLEWGHVSQEQGSRVKRSKRIILPGGGAKEGPVPVLSKREDRTNKHLNDNSAANTSCQYLSSNEHNKIVHRPTMPSPSKLIAPLKDAVKRNKGDSGRPTGSLGSPPALPPEQEPYIARDYVTIPSPSQEAALRAAPATQPIPATSTDKVDPSAGPQEPKTATHPLDVQSDLASVYTSRYADRIEPESEDDEGEQELTDTQLRRLYDDEEIERFLTVFSKLVTEVTIAPSVSSGNHRKTAVLRSSGQGEQGLEVDVYSVDDSDTETDIDEPWTYFYSSDAQSATNTPPTTPGRTSPVGAQPRLHLSPTPTYLSARVAAWIMQRLPITPVPPSHKFKLSTFRLAGQRIYVGTYPFYAPFFADLTRLATWSDWNRSARVCTIWWIFWYFNLLLPALFGKLLVSLMRRRVMPYPSLKSLRERRRLARGAEEIGDAVESQGAAASFFGTKGVPGMGQGGGDMGMREMLKMTRAIIKGKSKKGKEKVKDAGSHAATQMGLTLEDEEEDGLQQQLEEEDWRTSALKMMEDIADFHERLMAMASRTIVPHIRVGFDCGISVHHIYPGTNPCKDNVRRGWIFLLVCYPGSIGYAPRANRYRRIPPPLFDVPTDAEYAMSLMSIRVAKGESIVPASLSGGREHGRARRFIANMNASSSATKNPARGVEWNVSNPDQDVGSIRREAEEKESVVNSERAATARDIKTTGNEAVSLDTGSPAEVGTLARLKSSIEASTTDLLGNNKVGVLVGGSDAGLSRLSG
ncbi:hypothetical protein AG1IA_06581 [Rhizoctonia solani AG-1 IA]|uniref:Uncharacterized protein n=1 Tax=Thanatephorus cucumeris (strain AG1-IA) TaxID=983506 RepID=L8WRM7_THACA|nr:hypothetical protein AG1IA_06581 [Rhizoctonia solani AG-1 IA]